MKLFSVVLTNYNQENYIYEAIDSVLMQEYGRIQLIITDDASTNFNKKIIEDYINEKCGLNIESIDFITNKKNVGTVKTLNDALKIVKGDYVLFFAADDALFDPCVLSTFVKEFDINKDINALTSQAYMCGEELLLNVESRKFVKEEEMSTFNNYDSNEQFYYIANECPFVSGATAYRTNLFKKTNGFDVDFKLVEDWSFWLMITSIGEIIKYINNISLLHRNGGVSHSKYDKVPQRIVDYYKDIIKVYTKFIIPKLENVPKMYKYSIIDKYMFYICYYDQYIPGIYKENEEHTKIAWRYTDYEKYFNKVQKKKAKEEKI